MQESSERIKENRFSPEGEQADASLAVWASWHSCCVMSWSRLELAFKRGVFWTIEQPVSSLLPLCGPVLDLCKRHGARYVFFNMASFGAPTLRLSRKV